MTQVLSSSPQISNPVATSGCTISESAAPRSLSVRWIDSANDLEAIKLAWHRLAENSIWRNTAFEPNFLIPAFKHLSDGSVKILVVEESDDSIASHEQRIFGLFPVVKKRFYHLPISCLENWKHEQCFDTTPLIRKTGSIETLTAIFQFLAQQKIGLLSLDTVSAEPEFQALLTKAIEETGSTLFQRDSFSRAAFRPAENSDDYVKQFVSKSVKKKCGQRKRRLAEQGELTCELSNEFSDYNELAQQFLKIEASGWKAETGTALTCNASTKHFYEELVARSAELGKVRFTSLKLDGKPIAMLSDLQSGQTVFAFKTAFDEEFSAFSPGLQIELLNIELMHQSGIELADSCTDPDNATINRIWGQKLKFQSVVVGLRPGIAQIATRVMPLIQAAATKAKQIKSKND